MEPYQIMYIYQSAVARKHYLIRLGGTVKIYFWNEL